MTRPQRLVGIFVAGATAALGVTLLRGSHPATLAPPEPPLEPEAPPSSSPAPPSTLPAPRPVPRPPLPSLPLAAATRTPLTPDQRRGAAAVQRAFAEVPAAEAALYAAIERKGATAPPEAAELIARHRAGAPREELERYVREAFPREAAVRIAAMAWIDRVHPGDRPPRPPTDQQTARPLRPPRPAAGRLQRMP